MDDMTRALMEYGTETIERMVIDMLDGAIRETLNVKYHDEWRAVQTAWHLKTGFDPHVVIHVR